MVKGAYAQLPRYFSDADRVMDLEARLVWCRVKLQGMSEAAAKKNPFGAGNDRKSDLEALVAYITSGSRGVKMNVPLSHPKEREMYALGERMFFYRGGTHDFACATCHGENGKRIRLQDLPNLTIACRRERCARSNGASTTASGSSGFPSSPTRRTRPSP